MLLPNTSPTRRQLISRSSPFEAIGPFLGHGPKADEASSPRLASPTEYSQPIPDPSTPYILLRLVHGHAPTDYALVDALRAALLRAAADSGARYIVNDEPAIFLDGWLL